MADDDRDVWRLRREFAHSYVDPAVRRALRAEHYEAGGSADAPAASDTLIERETSRVGSTERTDGRRKRFAPKTSVRLVVPLIPSEPSARVIIELNPDFADGLEAGRTTLLGELEKLVDADRRTEADSGGRYLFVQLRGSEIERLEGMFPPEDITPILRIWRDEPLHPFLDRSIRTVKADACAAVFGADGRDIVVAVADSGIDRAHPHFSEFGNLDGLPPGVNHRNFTVDQTGDPLVDRYGHGTHVAGIVAGRTSAAVVGMRRLLDIRKADDSVHTVVRTMPAGSVMSGIAPRAKVVSLKVLDDQGRGYASVLIRALEYVIQVNTGGKLRIHCVNLSLGYPFEADWFASGQSPLCEVVDRLVRSGVVVVAAAGNDGSMLAHTEKRVGQQRVGIGQSINDPGNADRAITVGATHAEAPHKFGVSWFSSRGPTTDGRMKPDLVAPGERVVSCAAVASGKLASGLEDAGVALEQGVAYFREGSGTSVAAPHVSGAVAALLSIRTEFIGRPEEVKGILLRTCTDLGRRSDFQGAGLLDMLRAIQSI